MRRINRFLIPLAASGLLFLSGCDADTGLAESMGAGAFSQTYDISDDYSVLDIDVSIAELTIQEGEEASMEVNMDKWYKMDRVLQDDTLYLTEENDGPFWQKIIQFGSAKNSVLITLPEGSIEQLIVSSSNGNVEISGQELETMSVSGSNGNIIISNCRSTIAEVDNSNGYISVEDLADAQLTAELSNGNLEIADSDLASLEAANLNGKVTVSNVRIPAVDVQTKNGKVVFEKTDTDSIAVDSANGSIALELVGDEKSYNYEIGSQNGTITVGSNSFGSVSDTLTLANDADRDVVLDSSNGSCTVTFYSESE